MKHIVSVHTLDKWADYLDRRLAEYSRFARDGLSTQLQIVSIELVVPSDWNEALVLQHNLETRISQSVPTAEGRWKFRPDSYEIGADRLRELSAGKGLEHLFCFAEYFKPTDGVLKERPHIIDHDRVFLVANSQQDTAADVAKVLRQARSRRTLGIVNNNPIDPFDVKDGCIFLTDVFDGDVLLVSELAKNN